MEMKERFICTDKYPIVSTKSGLLHGYQLDDVFQFFGVEYAYAKRFERPQPPKPWKGIRDAMGYGYVCPTLCTPNPSGEVQVSHRFWPANEHCHNLNIWTKHLNKQEKAPVIVWFHGGGFSDGSAIEQTCYDGKNLAKLENVVVVTVNHRLNAFGFMDLSAYGSKWINSGNAGIEDLEVALRWVNENIEEFGGDPKNVTIMGQSGGGMKVTALGQCKSTEGLFHKAVIMSGILSQEQLQSDVSSADIAKETFHVLKIQEGDVESLQKVPVASFIRAVNEAGTKLTTGGRSFSWGPVKNQYFSGDPVQNGFSEYFRKIPTITASVFSEFSGFAYINPGKVLSEEESFEAIAKITGESGAKELIKAYKKAYPGKPLLESTVVDTFARPATIEYSLVKAKQSSASVYNYMFALEFNLKNGTPAWHCSDIPFVFHDKEVQPCMNMGGCADRLEDQLSSAIVNFARYGCPDSNLIPKWKPVTAKDMNTMIFDENTELRTNYDAELLETLKRVRKQPKISISQFQDDTSASSHDWLY